MEEQDLISVLWVDDDPEVRKSYPTEAEPEGLWLHAFSDWDEAKEELKNNYEKWSAIILDANCVHHKGEKENVSKFLIHALTDITRLRLERGRLIPWYILSGGAEKDISDHILEERMEWDADWTKETSKVFYSKSTDRIKLYKRIVEHHRISHKLQIQKDYQHVFEAFKECNIEEKGYNSLTDLLIPIHFPKDIQDKDYNDKFEKARKVLEYIFRSMSSHGILPDWGKQVNLQWSSCLLSGMHAKRKDEKKNEVIVIECKQQVIPPVFKRLLREMTGIIPAFCHSDNKESKEIKKEEYLSNVDNSTFLLKSFTLQICDLILWYKNFLKDNNDYERNASNWEIKDYELAKVKHENGSE